jgi:predicted DCC family thiol-disulfide oxidoreductase YuxK
MSTHKTIDIIFDGQCGFCIRSLQIVRALDIRKALRFHEANRPETLELFPELRGAALAEAMYACVQGEPPHRGFFAFRRLLWFSPLMWPLIPLFYFPGVSLPGERIYAWVARNRKDFGCESDLCPLPAASPSGDVQRKE